MRVIAYHDYGPPGRLTLEERPDPQAGPGEVLVRVHAASVNYGDLIARRFGQISPAEFNMPALLWFGSRLAFGWSRPRQTVLGNEYAGRIESVGQGVVRWKVGDRVMGYTGQAMGAYAERLLVGEDGLLVPTPAHLSDEQAAALTYGAIMALPLLRRAHLGPGSRVLVLGASGSLGSAAVQIARHQGAVVDGVAGTGRLDYLRDLGVDRAFDYNEGMHLAQSEVYDLVFDVLGRSHFSSCAPMLKPGGLLLLASFKTVQLGEALWSMLRGGKRMVCAFAPGSKHDLEAVQSLAEQGVLTPRVDRSFPMEEAAAAHTYAESPSRRGPVVIRLA